MTRGGEALQLGDEYAAFSGREQGSGDGDLPGTYDEYGELILDVEDAGPRDRTAEAQRYLEDTMVKARQLVASSSQVEGEDLFPTRNPAVDQLLAGGVGRGEMVEAVGWRSSGRFSLVLSLLAAATQVGESAALIDLGDHLDPEAAQRAGIDLERLLWMRPENIKQALGCAEMVIGTGFSLVVLDLGTPPLPGGRGAEAAWLRLQRACIANRCALFVSAPYRASGTAAHAVLELHRGTGGWLGARSSSRQDATPSSSQRRSRLRALDRTRRRARAQRAAPSPELLGGLLGAAELAKMRLARLKQAALQRRAQQTGSARPSLGTAAETSAQTEGHKRSTARGSSSRVVPLERREPSRTTVADVALQLAVRFTLRADSGSVAELAAPLRTRSSGSRGKVNVPSESSGTAASPAPSVASVAPVASVTSHPDASNPKRGHEESRRAG